MTNASTEQFGLAIEDASCRHILFAGCHDGAYLSLFRSINNNKRDKTTLVQGAGWISDFHEYGRVTQFPTVFRWLEISSDDKRHKPTTEEKAKRNGEKQSVSPTGLMGYISKLNRTLEGGGYMHGSQGEEFQARRPADNVLYDEPGATNVKTAYKKQNSNPSNGLINQETWGSGSLTSGDSSVFPDDSVSTFTNGANTRNGGTSSTTKPKPAQRPKPKPKPSAVLCRYDQKVCIHHPLPVHHGN